MDDLGYFLFSFDLELATGYFDLDKIRHKKFSEDGSRERDAIYRLIDLFEEYNVVGTWATVGHLFYDRCEDCVMCPVEEQMGHYSSLGEVYRTNNPLWYGGDIIETLLTRGKRQEIAFHGYLHKTFDENLMTQEEARIEIQEWLRAASRKGIIPRAAVFPRHIVGHLETLRDAGLICFRAEPKKSLLIGNRIFGRYIKAIDQILGISRVPLFDVALSQDHGVITLFSSECFFGLNRRVELFLDALNLHTLRFRRIRDGIRRAARDRKMIHIWAHPCDFRTEKDFMKLRYVFDAVTHEIEAGRMRSVGMTEMARIIMDGGSYRSAVV